MGFLGKWSSGFGERDSLKWSGIRWGGACQCFDEGNPLSLLHNTLNYCLVIFQLFFVLINSVFKVSVFVLLLIVYVRCETKGSKSWRAFVAKRFSYHINDWQNVRTGLTFLFWWRWYFYSIGEKLTCFCSHFEFYNSWFLLPSVAEMDPWSSQRRKADQSFVFLVFLFHL